MIKVMTAEQSQALDAKAEAAGVKSPWLMEVAGAKAAQYIGERLDGDRVLVVVGPGKNGGDGLVVARHLARYWPVDVVLVRGTPKFEEAAGLVESAARYGAEIYSAESLIERLGRATVIVDAILGTGIRAPLKPWAKTCIEQINGASLPCYALDVPSGVDANNGQVDETAIRAEATITFGASKWGHWCYPGTGMRGNLAVADIGLPNAAGGGRLIDADELRRWIKPLRADGHKYQRGRLAVIGGSPDMPGAPQMVAEAGLRMGIGLVQLMVPRSLIARLSVSSAMLVHGSDEDSAGRLRLTEAQWVLLKKSDAVVVGPGLGPMPGVEWIEELVDMGKPTVIDADGLRVLNSSPLKPPLPSLVLTPHEGEAARLLGISVDEVRADRLAAFMALEKKYGAAVVLKGPHTISGTSDHLYVNVSGIPELATAGSGDVLSGVIGGLLAAGYPNWQAATMGVYIHGMAARQAAMGHGQSLIAPDLIEALSGDWTRLVKATGEEVTWV
ncbi:MAG: NAD(P)H-hydrate dehydratase [Firmicutes bacterium]|jgi:NAD(P)H-hydrate epimerase|nr:NAD(P)H-hydrate dehydratase [Bacillota bacterium]MCL5063595.1 NAD(P)H-hydrate dehydratase [Bacillota bacterium]